MLRKNSIAPDFTLTRHDGKSFRLSEEIRSGPLILFFYPRDFTPICTAQTCMFRDEHEELSRSGVRVVGVSAQSPEEHDHFRRAYGLTYGLLSDPKRRVIRIYAGSVLGINLPLITRRVTYFIDDRMCIRERIIADYSAERHRSILEAARNPSMPR